MRPDPRRLAICAALALVACAPQPAPVTATGSPTSGPEATPTTAVDPASPTPPPGVTPIATPLAVPQLDGLLRSLASSWRPSGEAVIAQVPGGIDGSVLLAVPLDGSPQVPLVAFGPSEGWSARPDGSAIAISLLTGPSSARIAVWDSGSGRARWASPAEPGVLHRTPVWSSDGGSVYYSALQPPEDRGIFRASASGGTPVRVREPEDNGANLLGLTPDGRGLVWSRIQAGGSTEVYGLASRRDVSFDPTITSTPVSWRSTSPRALVITGGCCAGRRGKGTLTVWDDVEAVVRPIFGTALTANDGVTDAAWSPAGDRLVAVVHDLALPSAETALPLVLMDENGGSRTSLAGTGEAVAVHWSTSGILFQRGTGDSLSSELLLVKPDGGAPTSVYRGGYLIKWVVAAR